MSYSALIVSDERLKKRNIFVSHGAHDSVLKFGYATDAVGYLHSKGLQPEFHHYPEDNTIMGDVVVSRNNFNYK